VGESKSRRSARGPNMEAAANIRLSGVIA